jgi:hypothetical protein
MTRIRGFALAMLMVLPVFVAGCGSPPSSSTTAPQPTVLGPAVSQAPSTSSSPVTTSASPMTTTPATVTSAPPPAPILPGVPSQVYFDAQFGFSLTRPASALVVDQGFEGYLPLTQTAVVAFTLPDQLFAGTNLTEAGVYIGASSSAAAVSQWDAPVADLGEKAAGSEDIGGVTFAVFTSTGAAAGNIYDEKVFRTLHDGICFEIVELLHSGEIGNYGPEVKQFDRARFAGYLEAIVRSFAFTAG